MAELGINVAGRAEQSPADIAAPGARWARCVVYPDADIRTWMHGCHDRGIKVLLILARESIGNAPGGWISAIDHYATLYTGLADAWQIGNESDGTGESSWSMSYENLNRLLKTAREVLGSSAYLVGPGMVSGQPDWLRGVDLRPLNAVAVHPYAKWPETAELSNMLEGYAAYGKPLWTTEYHARTLGMAAYLQADRRVQVAMAFCYSDSMVQGFGLIENKAALADFKAATKGARPVTPTPLRYDVGPGILKRMAGYGTTPASDEIYVSNREGRTQWSEAMGMDGRIYRWLPATRQVLTYDPTAWIGENELMNPKPAPAVPAIQGIPTAEQVASVLGAPLENVRANWPLLISALDEQGIADRPTAIAAAATVGVEASNFLPIEEYRNADGSIPDYWNDYDGGATYHGRGLIQLTHRYNYVHYGRALGVDLAGSPSLALDPTISARVFALYFKEHGIQALAAKPDWLAVRKAVNGGTNGWDRFAHLVDAFVAL